MLVTGLAYAVNYGITLVLTPYITRTVGTEAYGFVRCGVIRLANGSPRIAYQWDRT